MVTDQVQFEPVQLLGIILMAFVPAQLPSCGRLPTTKTLSPDTVLVLWVNVTGTQYGPAKTAPPNESSSAMTAHSFRMEGNMVLKTIMESPTFNCIIMRFWQRNGIAPGVNYTFAVSIIPDRATLFNFEYLNISAPAVTVDLNVMNIAGHKFERAIDGIVVFGMKYKFSDRNPLSRNSASAKAFIIPFCRYLYIIDSSVEYTASSGYKFVISGINGISSYSGVSKSDEFMTLDCSGNILGRNSQKVYMKFYFYPYYKNKFFLNIFATGINASVFEPMFIKNRLKFDAGRINFLVQVKGEMRKICLNNVMQFENLKVRENAGLDLKALLGVSVEQLVDFLKDSKGNFYVNYNFCMDDSEFGGIFKKYGDGFQASVMDRLKIGIITAPLRRISDLIWNLTGENVARIFKLFGGGK